MARLYTDEDFSHPVARELRLLGHDVLTAQQAGRASQGINDSDQLAHAVFETRAILTLNRRHFIRLHRQNPNHCGIITCTSDNDCPALAQRIHDAILAESPLDNKLIRVYRPAKP